MSKNKNRFFFLSSSASVSAPLRLCGCILSLLIALTACHRASVPTVPMQIGNQSFNLELATTEAQQELGLMHRDHLDPSGGMIFIFPDTAVRTFWNHDVSFSLDLIFMDSNGKVVSIKRLNTYSDVDVSSDVPAKYAIELNAGTAASLGVKTGDNLALPPSVIQLGGR
jgi:uncharacterized membrane protein (UPF0127 family)